MNVIESEKVKLKLCIRCSTWKTMDAFAIHRKKKDGRQTSCRDCMKAIQSAYLKTEAGKERGRRNYRKRKEKIKVWKRAYMAKPEIIARERERYRKTNKTESARARQAKYWASKKGRAVKKNKDKRYKQTPKGRASIHRAAAKRRTLLKIQSTLTHLEWDAIKAKYKGRCYYCKKKPEKITMDHLFPVCRGGHHTADNVVPACMACNLRKGKAIVELF